ncbi:sigma-70 family RNA polymerase sigma factor [Paenibacillus sp. GCM10027626]|uniref:sigma-70 family RNA polymerase sigma factor n=1 Tax=Paenibacillus sp. GCM10027626 TaxID=3273411 RepID=UPI00363E3EEB
MDDIILKRLNDSPEKGLQLLMDAYMGLVYTIVSGKLRDSCSKEDIEECVSEVFFELFRSRAKIDPQQSSLKTFVALVATRKAINRYNKSNRYYKRIATLPEEELFGLADAESTEASNDYVDKETREAMIEGIKALGEPDSEIMIRKYYFGQNTKEVAEALQLKPATVDKKVSRGLAKLRSMMKGLL